MGNSSSTPSSSTTTNTDGEQFDVFISFRGTDTRKSFTSHLYRALDEKNITTFIDTQLVRGQAISDGLWRAIGESKISVVIFSENYASSEWCLRELTEIMKYREMNNQIVIPVFYHVDPSHVENQTGSYEAAFARHDQNELEEEVQKWRRALTRASNLSGWDSSVARDESKLVCNIVRDVRNKLNHISPSCDFQQLVKSYVGLEKYVGIEKHIAGVVSKLCLEVQDFRIIGIWGMGGMGKTTIADVVFHIISHRFENRTYFTSSVRAESEKDNTGLIRLRNEILSKVLNIKNQISGSPNIPQDLKKMLLQKKVLIVFDDADSIGQLETLAGDLDQLGPGSRIIVTTRDKQVLRNCGVKDHNMYEVKGLNDDEALQLFCKHAFKQHHPTEDFEDLSGEVVKIATDVPLAIRVFGSLLYEKGKQYWEDAVNQFQGIKNPTIFDRLKISYNGLDEEEKGLFLDIACFYYVFAFGGNEEDFRPNLLYNRTCFLDHLIDKSLVTVERGYIKMHDLLREMGRKIACENHSRLWSQEDVLRTLELNDGTDAVQGIFLSMFNLKDVQLGSQVFMKMYNLRTLIIKYGRTPIYGKVHLCNGDLDYLPDALRYLHWEKYHLEVLPSSFNPVNLVELDLSNSQIKQLWKGRMCFPKLKWLNLSYCENLIRIPDLSDIPSAESMNLERCRSLPEIQSSRECPKNLHSLNLSFCSNLSSLPSNIHLSEEPSFSTSVVLHSSREGSEFSLLDCYSLTKFPDISGNIKRLNLEGSGVEEVPSTIQNLSKLESLYMGECTSLKRISNSICKLKSLDRLHLSGCWELESFPDILEEMELKYLYLRNMAIKELPPSIGNLNRLEELDLSECKNLEKLPSSISNLKSLDRLHLRRCHKLESFPDILEGMELKYLDLSETAIKELPPSFGNLNRLEVLILNKNLETFPSSSPNLNLYECDKLEKLPPLSGLCSLKELSLDNCNLTEISEDIGCLSSLKRLLLDRNVFERLPNSIKKLSKLYHLSLSHCGMLKSLPELPSSLRYLDAKNCKQLIHSLPDESEFELCPDGSGSFYFNFLDCLELNQKAVSNLLLFFQVSVQKMQGMGTEKIISLFKVSHEVTYQLLPSQPLLPPYYIRLLRMLQTPDEEVKVGFCLLGSEIPEWFSYKNNGSSLNVLGLRNDCGRSSYIMGFAVCLVIGFEGYDDDLKDAWLSGNDVYYDFHFETSDGHEERFFHNSIQLFGMPDSGSDHILLGYNLSHKCYEFFQELDILLANLGTSDYVRTSFVFNIQPSRYSFEPMNCEVKHCGIQPIYVQTQVMNSVSINQDTGDTSGRNDIAEETRERHPKRICIEANQCSTTHGL